MKNRILLSGNEAVGRGAIEAAVRVVTGYPGTPGTDILDSVKADNIYKEWSTNEKVAFEVALGASIMGTRSLVVMKNAGANWIMDSLTATSYIGINGGLVIAVADDPGANYSVTEQDTRGLATYLKIPCFEPSNSQEAKDMTREAFRISEELELPVIIRTVSRVAYTVSNVNVDDEYDNAREPKFDKHLKREYRWNPYAPPRPVKRHEWLVSTFPKQMQISENSKFNVEMIEDDKSVCFVVSGIAYSYVKEAFPNASILKLGIISPIPEKKVLNFIEDFEKVYVIEEGDDVIENQVRQITDKKILTRKNKWGELSVDEIKNTILL